MKRHTVRNAAAASRRRLSGMVQGDTESEMTQQYACRLQLGRKFHLRQQAEVGNRLLTVWVTAHMDTMLPFVPVAGMCIDLAGHGSTTEALWTRFTVDDLCWVLGDQRFKVSDQFDNRFADTFGSREELCAALEATGWTNIEVKNVAE